jgi:polyphosphate kinase
MPTKPSEDLDDPSLFINRELSLLEFNRRVLEQALDEAIPLLERLRFLTISSSNLDEFFEIRAASHKERVTWNVDGVGLDGLTSAQTLGAIRDSAVELVKEQYRVLNQVLLPGLERQGVRLLSRADWTPEHRRWVRGYFRGAVLPVLTPIGLDPAHPFPRILGKSLNFVVQIEGDDAFGRDTELAVVQVPRALPRILQMPPEAGGGGEHDYVMLSSVVHAHVDELFPGMKLVECHQFRVTRDGDLWVDEEEVDDILKALQGELPERRYSEAVRLEVTSTCPDHMAAFLLEKFELGPDDLYLADGPVNLHRLDGLHDIERADLKYEPFVPRVPRRALRGENLFEAIRAGDILLHHPYESFQPVLELLRQAAQDPEVLAVKMTLYRTGNRSPVVESLLEAARNGKQVTVVVELRARFDEERNIDLATRLQEAGASVSFGVVGYKTHAKMLMIVRREGEALRRYVHLGTGNYHAGTARAYTDIGFLTSRDPYGRDVDRIFNQLTGVGREAELELLLHSPFTLHQTLLRLIDEEAERARAGQPARVLAKMNALTNKAIIQALYRASQAGVQVDLVVRGACCLRPGLPGVSENIRVRSVLGRFLEHSRLFYFLAGGPGLLYCASADWMSRNLLRRIETCFPIEDPAIQARVLQEDLELYLEDDVRAWGLGSNGRYSRTWSPEETSRDVQALLLEHLCGSDDLELEAEGGEQVGLVLDIGPGQGMGLQPTRGKGQSNRRAADKKRGRRKGRGAPSSGKPNRKPKKKD